MNDTADVMVTDVTEDEENTKMEMVAKMAAMVLTKHYPRHLWMVGWAPGATLVVKNMAIDDGRYGFTVDAGKSHSISHLEKLVMVAGGELLERCGAPRGSWDGEFMQLKDKST
jgi:hypothetical protein